MRKRNQRLDERHKSSWKGKQKLLCSFDEKTCFIVFCILRVGCFPYFESPNITTTQKELIELRDGNSSNGSKTRNPVQQNYTAQLALAKKSLRHLQKNGDMRIFENRRKAKK